MLEHIHFADPEYLYLLVVIPLAGVWYWFRSGRIYPEMRIPVPHSHASQTKKAYRGVALLCETVWLPEVLPALVVQNQIYP